MTHHSTQFRPRPTRAISLLESMILMVILAVIVLGTGVAFQSLVRVPSGNNRLLVANSLLVDKMEGLKSLGFTALSATANGTDSPVVNGVTYARSWTVSVNPGGAYDANFLQYSVTVDNQTAVSALCKP